MNLKAGKYLLTESNNYFINFKYANKLTGFSKRDLEYVNKGGFFTTVIRLFTCIDGKIVRIKSNGTKWASKKKS
jgi:hypothetical protein